MHAPHSFLLLQGRTLKAAKWVRHPREASPAGGTKIVPIPKSMYATIIKI